MSRHAHFLAFLPCLGVAFLAHADESITLPKIRLLMMTDADGKVTVKDTKGPEGKNVEFVDPAQLQKWNAAINKGHLVFGQAGMDESMRDALMKSKWEMTADTKALFLVFGKGYKVSVGTFAAKGGVGLQSLCAHAPAKVTESWDSVVKHVCETLQAFKAQVKN